MRACIIILIFLLVISASQSKEIAEGQSKRITGVSGTEGIGSYNNINDRVLRDYRDPSQYYTPPYKIPPRPTPKPPNPSDDINNTGSLSSTTSTVVFEMTSDVNGNGSFNEWKAARDISGLKAKEKSSSFNGDGVLSSRMAIFRDLTGLGAGYVVSRNSVFFKGRSYSDLESYSNNANLIQNRFQSSTIYKDSTFFGSYSNNSSSDEYDTSGWRVMKTSYDLTTQFEGTSSFSAHFQNETEIVEDYAGLMAINISLSDVRRYNRTATAESWLSCDDCGCKSCYACESCLR
jgi:hypothetical protein